TANVNGWSRVPEPPANTIPFIISPLFYTCFEDSSSSFKAFNSSSFNSKLLSSSNMCNIGSFLKALVVIQLSNDKSKEGNMIKLKSIATNKVMDTNTPKAMVPPKSDTANTPKPKNRMMEL